MKDTFKKEFSANLVFVRVFLFFLLMAAIPGQGQDANEPKKAKVRVGLEFFNNLTSGPYLKASVKTKTGRSYVPVVGETIHFYLMGDEEQSLGQALTDKKGAAVLLLDKTLVNPGDTVYNHSFRAALKDSKRFRDKDKQLDIREANMEVSFSGDSIYQILVLLTTPDSAGTMIPAPNAKITAYVKRLYSLLPVGEDIFLTDESGQLSLDFPNDIPGDEKGILSALVKLEDHDSFGNIILEKELKWGLPVTENEVITEGELWSARSNSPMYMVILVNSILIGIWGAIIYIIFILIKISRISRTKKFG